MNPRLARFAALALALVACPKAPPPLPPAPPREVRPVFDVRPLVAETQGLLKSQDEAVWKAWTTGGRIDLATTYLGHEKLFTLEAIGSVDQARAAATDPRELRALTYFKAYLAGEYLARGITDEADAVANLEASMTFALDGKEVPYRDLDRLLTTEKNTSKRRALYAAATSAVLRLNQSLERKDERLDVLIAELGYPSYETLGAELRQADLNALGFLADEVLGRTQSAYLQVMEQLAQRELSLPLAQLQRADLPRLLRFRGADAAFPKDALLPRATDTLRGLGIDLSKLTNLTLDLSEAKAKNPRRLSLAVQVPGDVRLSMRPIGGAHDQANLFHELGHCLHYGLATERRFELAKLGPITTSEAYSFLLEDLVDDPGWLEEQAHLSGEKLAQALFAANAAKLFLLRRAAGTLLYDLALRRNEGADPRDLHREIFSRALGVPMTADDSARYLVDAEELYQSADDFRAWLLAGQLQGQLKARFGPAWWHDPHAGDFLRGLWAHANARSAEEVAQEAGEPGLRADALLARLGSALSTPISSSALPLAADAGTWRARPGDGGVAFDPTDGGAWTPRPWGIQKPPADAGPLDAGSPDSG
jgi:hypothetical protein